MGETALERVAKARSVDELARSMEPVAELMAQLMTEGSHVIEQHQKLAVKATEDLEKATAKAETTVEKVCQRLAETKDVAQSLGWKNFLLGTALGLMLAIGGACYAYVALLNEYRVQAANYKSRAEDMVLLWKASTKAQQDEMTARVERFRSRSQPKP